MQRREQAAVEIGMESQIDSPLEQRTRTKFATLAPYMAEIERRKRFKSINRPSKKNLNDSSSKSFRIKEKSSASLHKGTQIVELPANKSTIEHLLPHKIAPRAPRERKVKSVQKQHDFSFSKTLENGTQKANTTFFNELYVRVKSKIEKDKERTLKIKPDHIEEPRARSEQTNDLRLIKIPSISENRPVQFDRFKINFKAEGSSQQIAPYHQISEELGKQKKTEQVKRNNFRRNKYEPITTSMPLNEDSRAEMEKKQSNVSINKEMDLLAEKQMENFYRQVRQKEIHKSIEKSTQKYFKYESYRPTKSRNEIEVYLSTIGISSLNKASRSTNDKSDRLAPPARNDLLDYDFDFRKEELQARKINETESDEESSMLQNSMREFQQRKRVVEADYFAKETPRLDWSEDECKMDDDI